MEPFIGEIRMSAFNYAPDGWMTCDGQILPIAKYSALFSVIGVQFGGNGTSTFALPDLRGRAPLHQGAGDGLTPREMGEMSGEETVALTVANLPAHFHSYKPGATGSEATTADPSDAVPANSGNNAYAPASDIDAAMGQSDTTLTGHNQAHSNMQPFQVVNFIIALNGIFPPHS